jgi:hypothetical protein
VGPALIELLSGLEGGFLWSSAACRGGLFGCGRDGLRRPSKELHDLLEGRGVRLHKGCRVRVYIQIGLRVMGHGGESTGNSRWIRIGVRIRVVLLNIHCEERGRKVMGK